MYFSSLGRKHPLPIINKKIAGLGLSFFIHHHRGLPSFEPNLSTFCVFRA